MRDGSRSRIAYRDGRAAANEMVYGRSRMRRHVRTIVVSLIGAGLMAFVLRAADLARVADAVLGARLDLIGLAVLAMVVTYVARAVRWCHLLEPLGSVRLAAALRATVMGFAATAVLPGRVGEILRPCVLARRERLSVSAAIGTVVLERLLDLAVILAIFGLSVLLFDPPPGVGDSGLLPALRAGAAVAAAFGLGALVLAGAAAASPAAVGRRVARLTSVLPGGFSRRLARLSHRFSEGLGVMRRPGPLVWSAVWTVVVWVSIAAGLWLVSAAFGIDASPAGAGVLLVLVALGVAVPTPAGVGGYHAAFQVGATVLFAATAEEAAGAGLVAHAVSFLPVTLAGVVLMAHEGVRPTRIGSLAAAAEEEAASGAGAQGQTA